MKKITSTLTILLAAALAAPVTAVAQDFYDDLYYSPSKAAEQKKKEEEARRAAAIAAARTPEYNAADTYTAGAAMPLNVDVDAYNRRSGDASASQNASALPEDEFSYTRRIERYHNPDVVVASGDTTLMEYYYNTPSEQDINVYVINTVDPFDYAWGGPGWSFYNPYRYYGYWRPGWSFGWGFDPWFDISWGWGSPWYGPAWGWGWNWGWTSGWHPGPGIPGGGPHPGLRPPGMNHCWASNSPGASRPHRPNSAASNRGPGNTAWNPSATRPGNMGRPSAGSSFGRPGSQQPGVSSRPGSPASVSNNQARPSNNNRRGSSSTNYHNSNSNNTYRNTSSPSRNSGSTFRNTGGGGSRSTGGGGRSTGGGAGRGRR